jgi:tetratricopeptide (TPR) repeat protein
MSHPANRKQVNQKQTATKRLLQYFANLFQSRKQANQQIAAKDINAGGNVTIEHIVQTIIQIVKPDRPRSLSIMLAQGGLVIFILGLLVAAINGKLSPSNAPSITYAPSTTVENKNTYLINNPPLSLLNKSAPTEAEKKDAQQKVSQYQQEVQKNPNSAVAHTNLGEALRRTNDLEGASKEHQEALQLNPNMQEAKVGLALVEQDKGNTSTAKQKLQEALDQKENAFAYFFLGLFLYYSEDLNSAEVAFRKAIALDSNHAGYHLTLAALLDEQGKVPEAITKYKEAIRIAPNAPIVAWGHNNIGVILDRQGNLNEAIAEYQKAISLNASLDEAHIHLADALSKTGQLELAIIQCKEAIHINSSNAMAHVVWGVTLTRQSLQKLKQGNLKEGVDKQKEGTEHFQKARNLYRAQGDTQKAHELDQILSRWLDKLDKLKS